ncbi:hypothetical protein [Nostoc sp. 'Peltigera membranacea cyanobiont' 213]|nr:hypothetical protein [Nostoc sp. 'Peltigera membranacea cyanobiont' 213]
MKVTFDGRIIAGEQGKCWIACLDCQDFSQGKKVTLISCPVN